MALRGSLVLALLLCAVPADAQQSVTLEFSDGLVTLRTQNAPVRTILAEWARLGGATIVNGDRVAGPPVTLELTAVPERQALDIVLRNVAGYMLGPRRAEATGVSAFDRILILPTSVAPRNPPPPPTTAAAGRRPAFPQPAVLPRPVGGAPGELPPDAVPTDETNPNPSNPFMRVPVAAGAEQQGDDEQADDQPPDPAAGGVAPTPTNPFGVPTGSSATPGFIPPPAPRPQQQQQQPPANRVQ
jgi:hypothetical protein